MILSRTWCTLPFKSAVPLVQRRDYILVPPVFGLISGLYRAQPYLLHISGFEYKLSLYTDAPCAAVACPIQMLRQRGDQHSNSRGAFRARPWVWVTACELCLSLGESQKDQIIYSFSKRDELLIFQMPACSAGSERRVRRLSRRWRVKSKWRGERLKRWSAGLRNRREHRGGRSGNELPWSFIAAWFSDLQCWTMWKAEEWMHCWRSSSLVFYFIFGRVVKYEVCGSHSLGWWMESIVKLMRFHSLLTLALASASKWCGLLMMALACFPCQTQHSNWL